jgi:hypothetical protein
MSDPRTKPEVRAAMSAYWGAETRQAERLAYENLLKLGLTPSYGQRQAATPAGPAEAPLRERGFYWVQVPDMLPQIAQYDPEDAAGGKNPWTFVWGSYSRPEKIRVMSPRLQAPAEPG